MDFWDLTRVLVRRWMIVLPMVALSGLAVLTVGQAKPEYIATAYVQLVPPVFVKTKAWQATPDQRNPWIGLGLKTIGNAAIVAVTDGSAVDQLDAAGYSDSFTITMGENSPLVTFEIVGKSQQQALQTAAQLVERFTQSMAALQSEYGVAPADSITGRRLDLGTNVTDSDSKGTRALIAAGGAAVLMTAAVTVGLDAWLRKRRRRRDEARPKQREETAPATGYEPT